MNTKQTLECLRHYESRNVTFLDPDGTWPIVWERAQGMHVWDAEGRKYLDLTAAFGVAAAGHANSRVVRAGQRQMQTLLHAMGDVHPHALKAQLARELSRLTFKRWSRQTRNTQHATCDSGKTVLCNSGFEAVEAGLKTARLATGKPGIIAFEGAYHGLGYGALNATHRKHFSGPFENQLRRFGHFVPFPKAGQASCLSAKDWKSHAQRDRQDACPTLKQVEAHLLTVFKCHEIGAVLVEPIQARGGINVPPVGFLPLLRKLCDRHGALLIVDEIYTGFGRTGKWFACEHSDAIPDMICLGKALTGGFPLSACVGRADLMDAAWPVSTGEAIHTSTFLGHPVGCAMALANVKEIKRLKLVQRTAGLGALLLRELASVHTPRTTHHVRGLGLMAGVEFRLSDGSPATQQTLDIVKRMLQRGFILLPEGEHANVISFTPPLTITKAQIRKTVRELQKALDEVLGSTRLRRVGSSVTLESLRKGKGAVATQDINVTKPHHATPRQVSKSARTTRALPRSKR